MHPRAARTADEGGTGRLGFPETQNTFGVNAGLGIVLPITRTAAATPTVRFHFADPSKLIAKATFVALQLDTAFGL